MNNLKVMIEEKDILTKKLDMLVTEFEVSNTNIKALEQTHDGLIFDGASTDISLVELTTASIHRDSLRRVIGDIQENMIPIADQRIEIEEEAAREDIRAARQTLYDKCTVDIQKKTNDILKIIQSFDIECQKVEDEAGLSAGMNQPIFYIQEHGRLQFTD